MKKRLFKSLQAKYMLLICIALILFQVVYLGSAVIFTSIERQMTEQTPDYTKVEQEWHNAVQKLGDNIDHAVEDLFESWSKQYPEATMFWVNGNGELTKSWNVTEDLPANWSAIYTAQYIKSRYGNDPFTVIAFASENGQNGFVSLELPRNLFNSPNKNLYFKYGNLVFAAIIIVLASFIVISYLFFRNIRKRLLTLQDAMTIRDVDALPIPIEVKKQDEIGQLEQSFNQMVYELKLSRAREQEEEQVRRQLIANLSHDIRTPLTKIRANAYTLSKFELPSEAVATARALEGSIRQLDELVDNLLAYTLLIGDRYRMELKQVAMPRFLREQAAAWYAVFEQNGFEFEVKLDEMKQPNWNIDRSWMKRIIDNLLQNVLRHAAHGKYVAIETASCEGYDVIRIIDRGFGIAGADTIAAPNKGQADRSEPNKHVSSELERNAWDEDRKSIQMNHQAANQSAGSGIGLSIVDMMIKGMGLTWTKEYKHPYFIVEIRKPYQ